MRQIHKQNSSNWFEQWKANFKSTSGREPHYADLSESDRRKLRDELVSEQGRICCYCMRRIGVDSSHIEHFKPRDPFIAEDLSYVNMFASCTGQQNTMQLSFQHCDQKKNNWYNENIPKPTETDFEKCVSYSIDGTVKPYHHTNDKKRGLEIELINNLGLNAPFLVRNRFKAIEQSEIMDELDFSEDDWRDMIKYYDEMHAGQYEEYCVAFIDIIRRDCISRK